MGFDIDAFVPRRGDDERIDAAFARAAIDARELGIGVDGFLELGSLDCGDSIGFLLRALGREPGPIDGIWSPEEVLSMSEAAV